MRGLVAALLLFIAGCEDPYYSTAPEPSASTSEATQAGTKPEATLLCGGLEQEPCAAPASECAPGLVLLALPGREPPLCFAACKRPYNAKSLPGYVSAVSQDEDDCEASDRLCALVEGTAACVPAQCEAGSDACISPQRCFSPNASKPELDVCVPECIPGSSDVACESGVCVAGSDGPACSVKLTPVVYQGVPCSRTLRPTPPYLSDNCADGLICSSDINGRCAIDCTRYPGGGPDDSKCTGDFSCVPLSVPTPDGYSQTYYCAGHCSKESDWSCAQEADGYCALVCNPDAGYLQDGLVMCFGEDCSCRTGAYSSIPAPGKYSAYGCDACRQARIDSGCGPWR